MRYETTMSSFPGFRSQLGLVLGAGLGLASEKTCIWVGEVKVSARNEIGWIGRISRLGCTHGSSAGDPSGVNFFWTTKLVDLVLSVDMGWLGNSDQSSRVAPPSQLA